VALSRRALSRSPAGRGTRVCEAQTKKLELSYRASQKPDILQWRPELFFCLSRCLPHYYYADLVVWDKILFEAKAVEKLTDSHIKQVLNYLAASKLRIGLLVNFGGDVLEWKRIIL
jgi:hypothetical protein